MKICEDCRQRHNWKRQQPIETGDCDLCWTRSTSTSEITHLVNEQPTELAKLKIILQEQRQKDFRLMAEAVSVFHTYGPRAGQVNQDLTNQLHEIEVKINGDIDWEASYLRRLRAKDAIEKAEAYKRDATSEFVR